MLLRRLSWATRVGGMNMARTELDSIVAFTRNLLSDVAATTWSSTAPIVDALDQHSVRIDWTPLRHDLDYHIYEAKGRSEGTMREALAGVRDSPPASWSGPDFSAFYRVGHFDTGWVIRDQADESGAAQSPSAVNAVAGSWAFSTAPGKELYVSGTVFNPWLAAADLLLETPDTGREYDTQRTRGQVSRTIKLKVDLYAARGLYLNRRRPYIERA